MKKSLIVREDQVQDHLKGLKVQKSGVQKMHRHGSLGHGIMMVLG